MKILDKIDTFNGKYGVYILFLVFIILGVYVKVKFKAEDKKLDKNGEVTVARVFQKGINPKTHKDYLKYSYYVQDINYTGVETFYKNEVEQYIGVDDFFKLEYLPETPSINRIDLTKRLNIESIDKYFNNQNPFDKVRAIQIDKYGTEYYAKVDFFKKGVIGKKSCEARLVIDNQIYEFKLGYYHGPSIQAGDSLRIKILNEDLELTNIYFDKYNLVLTNE